MDHFTLNNNDLKACIELAADGVNLHLQDQSKLEVIHKVMYAIATAAQNNQTITKQLEVEQKLQYTIQINSQTKVFPKYRKS